MKTATFSAPAIGLACAVVPAAWADDAHYPQSVTGDWMGQAPAKTRAQVIAELREANRLGLVGGEEIRAATAAQTAMIELAGRRAADAAQMAVDDGAKQAPAKTRAQVIAELREAIRLGLVGGEEIRESTAEQERMIELAGRHAVEAATVAQGK